jgi:hypothetical protein
MTRKWARVLHLRYLRAEPARMDTNIYFHQPKRRGRLSNEQTRMQVDAARSIRHPLRFFSPMMRV